MDTVTGVMLALIATKKQGNVTVSLSYSVCFIQLSLWLLWYLHWILILKYNIMGHAPHYHIRSRLRVLTLMSKNSQAQLPCSLERNLLLKIEYTNFFLFAPVMYFAWAVGLLGLLVAWPLLFLSFPIQFFVKGKKHQVLKIGKNKYNNTWDKIALQVLTILILMNWEKIATLTERKFSKCSHTLK